MHPNPSITVLTFDEDRLEALTGWMRGMEWVRWMLSGVRQSMPLLAAADHSPETEATARASWHSFIQRVFLPIIGPALRDAWSAANRGHSRTLEQLARAYDTRLEPLLRERSTHAAQRFLQDSSGALFQGVLGKHRSAIDEGRCPAHFIFVWAAWGDLFQLGFANVCTEYLRLEWIMLTRHLGPILEPTDELSIASITRRLLASSPLTLQPH